MRRPVPRIVAIGGGEMRKLATLPIDRTVVRLTGKRQSGKAYRLLKRRGKVVAEPLPAEPMGPDGSRVPSSAGARNPSGLPRGGAVCRPGK